MKSVSCYSAVFVYLTIVDGFVRCLTSSQNYTKSSALVAYCSYCVKCQLPRDRYTCYRYTYKMVDGQIERRKD